MDLLCCRHNSGANRRLRNATVSQCSEALGLTVNELRTLPLERLLPRMHGKRPFDEVLLKMLTASSTLPELTAWLERNEKSGTRIRYVRGTSR